MQQKVFYLRLNLWTNLGFGALGFGCFLDLGEFFAVWQNSENVLRHGLVTCHPVVLDEMRHHGFPGRVLLGTEGTPVADFEMYRVDVYFFVSSVQKHFGRALAIYLTNCNIMLTLKVFLDCSLSLRIRVFKSSIRRFLNCGEESPAIFFEKSHGIFDRVGYHRQFCINNLS